MRRLVSLTLLTFGLTAFSFAQAAEDVTPPSTSTTSSTTSTSFLVQPSTTVSDRSTLPKRTTTTTSTTTTTTTTVPLPEGKCSEYYPMAVEAGWSIDHLTKIGSIAWAESRCTHDIANKTYSYGLVQIEWSAHKGWLGTEFGITSPEELFDPVVNLTVAKWLYDYAERHYGCGWQPWYMSGDWC